MDITAKLQEARKCISQAIVGLGDKEKSDVFEIRIPNLKPDEVEIAQDEVSKFAKELLNKLTARRNQNV